MSQPNFENGERKGGEASSRARKCKTDARLRYVVDISSEEEEEATRAVTPSPELPSTSGVRIRENISLDRTVRLVRKEGEDPKEGRDQEMEEDTEAWESEKEEPRGEEMAESESSGEPTPKKRGGGRPALKRSHAGELTGPKLKERARKRKERKDAAKEEEALDPMTEVRFGPRLSKARRDERELLEEMKEFSSAGLTAVVAEKVALLRKVAQRCTKLKGNTIKALWDVSVSMSAVTAALNIRSQETGAAVALPEWESMREEMRQLRSDLTHMRSENESLKEEVRRERTEREKLSRELERERKEREEREKDPLPPGRISRPVRH